MICAAVGRKDAAPEEDLMVIDLINWVLQASLLSVQNAEGLAEDKVCCSPQD